MNSMVKVGLLFLLIWLNACRGNDPVEPTGIQSGEASLLYLELEHEGTAYSTTINGATVALDSSLPFNAQTVTIRSMELSPNATANWKVGDEFVVLDGPFYIEVRAENQQSQQTYSLLLDIEEADYAALLFDNYTASNCGVYTTFDVGELRVENNVWNTGGLPANSYSQCIYGYDQDGLQLLGWEWQYPDNAPGVNAYPQLIYGFKPWQPPSTTSALPRKVSEINKLKVTYEVEVTRNDGDYNLAFDNWINSSANVTPQNILFEFMIWEDTHRLLPFGDYQGDVVTSNGTYRFFMGEPDWEPPGSNWTYLAFQRIGNRNQGTVDVDELLAHLVSAQIVSGDSYLASVELGNEVGNSRGRTIVKEFAVELE